MKKIALCFLLSLSSLGVFAQQRFTEADTLRGMLRPERTCYDVTFYDLNVAVDIANKSIRGNNQIHYRVKQGFNMLQIDLFANMNIDSILHNGKSVTYYRKHNAVFVDLGEMQEEEKRDFINVFFSGKPRAAVNAPWDGGFTWTNDSEGKDWVGVSCEGIGASLWWPNKDHLSDEPDSMRITCSVPKDLKCVANGVQRSERKDSSQATFEWFVSYPINNYNVTLNIGNYVHFSDTFTSTIDQTKLPLDYYVLPYNLEKAKKQFKETALTLKVMEKYLDKYPFWNDGFALVETPYLGMEHQGAIAYGNRYMKGYLGNHVTGIPFDYIIMHESAHEWWGNSISCRDHAELWIHETFTTYMEAVYVEELHSYADAVRYIQQHAVYVANMEPIVGPKNVNYDKLGTDIYYKGSAMLHTLRNTIANDTVWWGLLKSFYQKHKISNVNTEDFINYVNETTKQDYTPFFQQYLFKSNIPKLEYKITQKGKNVEVKLKAKSNVPDFFVGVPVLHKKEQQHVRVTTKDWASITIPKCKIEDVKIGYGLYYQEQVP